MRPGLNFLIGIAGIVLGVLSSWLGLKGFLLPNYFFDGGVTGLSMFFSEIFSVPLSLVLICLNVPFLALVYLNIQKAFAIRSFTAILLLAICLAFLPAPVITKDKILAAIFGGFFLGAGIGLAVRNNAVLDGTEIMALLISRRFMISIGDVIFIFNAIIFSVIGLTLGVERALYSILAYIVASRCVDFFIHGIEEYNVALIISEDSEKIRKTVLWNMKRGVTVFNGRTGLKENPVDILFCVITRLEIPKLRSIIKEIDRNAFIVMHKVDDIVGGMTKRGGVRF